MIARIAVHACYGDGVTEIEAMPDLPTSPARRVDTPAGEALAALQAALERLRHDNIRLQKQTEAVAEANAHAVELMVELEETRESLETQNQQLQAKTEAVAEANAHAAELMVELEEARELLEAQNQQLEQHNAFIRQTFGRYLTNDVVKSLLESPEALQLGGERRKVTLVMTDLRGFTSMSGRLAPEQVVMMLNRYLGKMIEVIQHYQGTIDEFIGDAIFIIFGAPMQRQDDAERAVACALAMQLAMEHVNAQNRDDDLPEVDMGIGIHTGEVVVGNIGSDIRAKYGVVGSAVNLTARIESYTVGGQVLISEATRQEVGPLVQVGERFEVEAKGIDRPITIYEVRRVDGAFNLALPEMIANLVNLPQAVPFQYTVLDGKHMREAFDTGHLVKLSTKNAEVRTHQVLEPWSNIKMKLSSRRGEDLTGELYAKVMGALSGDGSGATVHFTSIPPDIEVYFHDLIFSQTNGDNV